jgi:LPS export ABC transporter protein LptC
MNHSLNKLRPYIVVCVIVVFSLIVLSCENKVDFIPKSDFLSHPSITAKDFQTIFTDSGKLQLILTAPLMEKYNTGEFPYTEFRFGMVAVYYNGNKLPVGSTSSKYARFNQTENLWILKDSVVVINESGDKLETELLNWDQTKDLIYTDRFVKITNEDQIIMGTGFESDPRLVKRRIKKVIGTIYLKNEK